MSVKRHYKRIMLRKVCDIVDDWETVQATRARCKRGCAGLAQGAPAHLKDVSDILASVWESFPPETIASCWVHSKILPPNHLQIAEDVVANTMKAAKQQPKFNVTTDLNDALEDVIASLSQCKLPDAVQGRPELLFNTKVEGCDLVGPTGMSVQQSEVHDSVMCEAIKTWLDYEADQEVMLDCAEMELAVAEQREMPSEVDIDCAVETFLDEVALQEAEKENPDVSRKPELDSDALRLLHRDVARLARTLGDYSDVLPETARMVTNLELVFSRERQEYGTPAWQQLSITDMFKPMLKLAREAEIIPPDEQAVPPEAIRVSSSESESSSDGGSSSDGDSVTPIALKLN